MSDPIKLTDEVLGDLDHTLATTQHPWATKFVPSIRALRDAAEEAVLRAGESMEPVPPYVQAAIDALASLLPDEPKGGG